MGNLFSALNSLKANIFGAPSTGETTPILRKSAIELADTSPTSRMLDDPFAFASISYPRDLTNDMKNGHYMMFYINRQNKTNRCCEHILRNLKIFNTCSTQQSEAI